MTTQPTSTNDSRFATKPDDDTLTVTEDCRFLRAPKAPRATGATSAPDPQLRGRPRMPRPLWAPTSSSGSPGRPTARRVADPVLRTKQRQRHDCDAVGAALCVFAGAGVWPG